MYPMMDPALADAGLGDAEDDDFDAVEAPDSLLPDHRYLDRELSWLAFNQRVLELAEDPSLPELERANFLASQPQLNVRNPAVQDALIAAARFWLDRGVDGFRLDAINFAIHDPSLRDNPPIQDGRKRTRPFDFQDKIYNQSHPDIIGFLNRIRALTDSYEGRFTVAEVGGDHADREMKEFTAGNDRLHSAYGFLYLYADTLKGELIGIGDGMWPDQQGEGWPSWTFSNHDAPRAVSRWAKGRDEKTFSEMALLLLMCLRGNVFVYQGEELGLPQAEVPFERLVDPEAIANWPETLGRDGARTPIPWVASAPNAGFSTVEPWLPVDPRHLALAVDAQEADPTSILHAARRIIALRQAHPALRTGGLEIESAGDLVVFRRFERAEGGERLLCVFNLGFEALDWSAPAGARRIAAVNWTEADGSAQPSELIVRCSSDGVAHQRLGRQPLKINVALGGRSGPR